jgi:ankyrin repeat protein
MIGLGEVTAEQLDTTKEHLATAQEQLQLQKSHAQKKLSDEEAKCHQMLRLTNSTSDATYEWYKDRVEKRVEGTCHWFVGHDTFRTWMDQNSGPLLVTADPGCGKSVLAKYLIDHVLAGTGATICYFFFKDQDQNTVRQALSAILHQLFTKKPTLIKHAMDDYRKDGTGLVNSTGSLWKVLRRATRDPEADRVIIVLDALDECAEEEFADLIQNLQEHFVDSRLKQACDKLRYLLTSRPYDQIISKFSELLKAFPDIHIPGQDASDAISEEVNCVVTYRVNQLSEDKGLTFETRTTLEYQLKQVEHRTYLWVYLVFDHLEKEGFKRTSRGVESTVATLPKGVNEAYEKILNKSKDHSMVRKALTIIFAATRPLTLEELNVAVEVGESSKSFYDLDLEDHTAFGERLRDWCGLFISVHHGKVYFLHQTAREFLSGSSMLSEPRPSGLVWHKSIESSDAHDLLAKICLIHLNLFNSNVADTHGKSNHPTDESVFLDYSARNWGEHFRGAGTCLSDGNISLALKICDMESESYSRWFQVWWSGTTWEPTENFSALMVASFLGLERLAERLLKQGAKVNSKDTRYGRTALIWAAGSGNEEIVDLLIQTKKADLDSKDSTYGQTPLFWAASDGHEGIVKLLLATGKVDPDSKDDEYGQTPLSWAAREGHEGIIKLLLATGKVDPDLKAKGGITPLSWAASEGHEGIVKLLLATGKVDLHSKDDFGQTPLSWAASNRHEGIVKLLLATGKVDPDSKDEGGMTPLSWAASDGHEGIVKLLLATGKVDLRSKDDYGQTPLSYATEKGHEGVMALLTEAGGMESPTPRTHTYEEETSA